MNKNKVRFSKAAVIEELSKKIVRFEETYKFTTHTGYAQVKGKGEEINRAYGEYVALVHLIGSELFD